MEATTPRSRHNQFNGSPSAYPSYLEDLVEKLEKENAELKRRLQSLSQSTTHQRREQLELDPFKFEVETIQSLQSKLTQPATKATKPKEAAELKDEAKAAVTAFLSKIPASVSEWSDAKGAVGLFDSAQIVDAFQILTGSSTRLSSWLPTCEYTIQSEAVDAFYGLHDALRRLAGNSNRLSIYSLLLFFCICAVARESDISVDVVDQATRHALGTGHASSYFMRHRTAAKFAARVIGRLGAILGQSSSLIFLVCKSPRRSFTTAVTDDRRFTADSIV